MVEEKTVKSIEELIAEIRSDYKGWKTMSFPWYRGEPNDVPEPLLPRLYRKRRTMHRENTLLQEFRLKAPSLAPMNTPPRDHTDEWLFLAQHVGLPTRLLDWTEELFIALYFAMECKKPVIWMLDPIRLNQLSASETIGDNSFPLTWFNPQKAPATITDIAQIAVEIANLPESKDSITGYAKNLNEKNNLGNLNIRGAWELDHVGTELPVAIHPTNIHVRMHTQKSYFTIHGKKKESLSTLVGPEVIRKYIISSGSIARMRKDLRMIGVSHSSAFPDLEHLAKDLSEIL